MLDGGVGARGGVERGGGLARALGRVGTIFGGGRQSIGRDQSRRYGRQQSWM